MKNLLHQLRRISRHMKNIVMKIMSKMLNGTKISAQTIIGAIITCVLMPIGMLFLGLTTLILITFEVLGGAPINNVKVFIPEVNHYV